MDSDDRRREMNKLRIKVDPSHPGSDMEEDEVTVAREGPTPPPPPAWSQHPAGSCGIGNNKKRFLTKQLSMKETTREAKWEKRRRQILRRSGMVSVASPTEEKLNGAGRGRGGNKCHVHGHVRSSSERARCLTDEDLDELRGSFELGFGFDEENGGADLRNTLPALDFYFAVNRQLSDPKLRSPTSTLSAVSSSSNLLPDDTPSPRSPSTAPGDDDAWKIFTPGDHPQLIKTRLRHWAQVVACSIKHGC